MRSRQKQIFRALGVSVACIPAYVNAQPSHSYLTNDHFVYAGIYYQEGELSAKSSRGESDPVNIESDGLGVDDPYISGMVDYHYRFSERWKISASVYRFTDGASGQRLNEDITWEGREFSAGVALDVDWKIDTYIVDAMYSIKRTENLELAVGGGLHAVDAELTLSGEVAIDGSAGNQVGAGETARGSLLVPLPNLRATGFYAFNDQWSLQGTVGWLSLGIDEYEGAFKYFHLRTQYQISDKVGVSLGYQLAAVDVEEELRLGFRRFDMSFEGVTAALTFTF